MSKIEHKSLREEILYVLGRSTSSLDSSEIYERCTLAEEIKRVSDALWFLRDSKKIKALDGEGRKRYVLANASASPAGQADTEDAPAAPIMSRRDGIQPDTGVRPDHETSLPRIDIPTLGAPDKPQRQKPGPKPKQKPVPAEPRVKGREEAAHRATNTGGEIVVNLTQESAALADALIAESRQQLAPGLEDCPQWWIDQDGCLEVSDRGDNGLLVEFSREQALLMAEMIIGTNNLLGRL